MRPEGGSPSRPVAVAITGGIGAGKTEALNAFARHGAATISSDDIVHRLLREDDDVRSALLERFGTGILDDAGNADRAAISRIVFDEPQELAWLESLLNREGANWQVQELITDKAVKVGDIWEISGKKLRRARARVAAEEREARLLADEEKAARADFTYVNDGTRQQLDDFVAETMGALEAGRRK